MKRQSPKDHRSQSLLENLANRIGWPRTIALTVIVGIALSFIPKSPYHASTHPTRVHHTPGPMNEALSQKLEELRLATKKIVFDPAYEQAQRNRKRRAEPSYPPIALANMKFTLGPRRVFAAKGDKDVPPHREDYQMEDRKRFHIAYGTSNTVTHLFFFITEENVAPQPLKATAGILTLRDKTGEALYRQLWHFPNEHPPGALLKERSPYHRTFADMQRGDSNRHFRTVLHTPESELKLDWTPMFVCYADGTMEGDIRPYLAIYGEDLDQFPSLRWIANLQYPNGIPDKPRR